MAVERAGGKLSFVMEENAGGLILEEIDWIHELVSEGLVSVCLCQHGIGRSFGAAQFLTDIGLPSIYIDGGFEELASLDLNTQLIVAKVLSIVPNVLMFLDQEESRRMFPNEIALINSQRSTPARVVRPPYIITSEVLATLKH